MEQVEVRDLSVCCELTGEGYPLVLIMGLTGNVDNWHPDMVDILSRELQVLAFDNRGAGRTVTPDEGEFTIELFADDTVALIEAMAIEKTNIFGVSMGGMIAQELALKYPEKVNNLVLGCTNCGGERSVLPSQEVLQTLMDRSGGDEAIFERMLNLTFPADYLEANPDLVEIARERFMRAPCTDANAVRQFTACLGHNTYDRLPEIKASTLVMTGTDDMLVPPENSRIIAEHIPGAKLVEYEGAGHLFSVQYCEAVTRDLIEFLR